MYTETMGRMNNEDVKSVTFTHGKGIGEKAKKQKAKRIPRQDTGKERVVQKKDIKLLWSYLGRAVNYALDLV